MSPLELAQSISARTRLNQRCVRRDGRPMAHVSTADNARDLDLLRAAVGEEKISYYGTSYGTFLGATYINMFPQRVRAAVLDGAVSPRAWAGNDRDARTLTTFLRIGSDHGAADTLKAFMRECGRVAVAQFVQQVWTAAQGRSVASTQPPAPASVTPAPATASIDTTSLGRQAAVVCGESPNPATPPGYAKAARASYRRAGPNIWPFAALCRGWSVTSANRYLGPWTAATLPVLVIGNTFDPATPYSSSQRMAAELANGHLLSVDGFGHTVLLNPNRCAQDHVASYLIDGLLPPAGARCAADASPFAQ